MILVYPVNGLVQIQVFVDPYVIIVNSNHSTGPSSLSSSSCNAGSDHKIVPATIRSERNHHMHIQTTLGPLPKLVVLVIGLPFETQSLYLFIPPTIPYPAESYIQQQPVSLSTENQPMSMRDYTR